MGRAGELNSRIGAVGASSSEIQDLSAGGCVGIIIGVVLLTGVGTEFPNAIVPLAKMNLMLALVAIMFCSIIRMQTQLQSLEQQ